MFSWVWWSCRMSSVDHFRTNYNILSSFPWQLTNICMQNGHVNACFDVRVRVTFIYFYPALRDIFSIWNGWLLDRGTWRASPWAIGRQTPNIYIFGIAPLQFLLVILLLVQKTVKERQRPAQEKRNNGFWLGMQISICQGGGWYKCEDIMLIQNMNIRKSLRIDITISAEIVLRGYQILTEVQFFPINEFRGSGDLAGRREGAGQQILSFDLSSSQSVWKVL